MADSTAPSCALCGKAIDAVPSRRGPAPKYCCQAHRQRAYEDRRRAAQRRDVDDARVLLELDNRSLRHDNERLWRENDMLRADLRAARDEAQALRTAQPGYQDVPLTRPLTATPEPAPSRSSRWLSRRAPR